MNLLYLRSADHCGTVVTAGITQQSGNKNFAQRPIPQPETSIVLRIVNVAYAR